MEAGPSRQFKSKEARASYLRSFAFGVEDGLVSTVGLLAGIASADVTRRDILVTGAILIVVEAFAMATGSFLSESEGETYEYGKDASVRRPIIDGLIMFASYLVAGLLPLMPYVLLEVKTAFFVSIAVSLVALLGLGAASARISRVGVLKSALRMLVVGGMAVAAGILIGRVFQLTF